MVKKPIIFILVILVLWVPQNTNLVANEAWLESFYQYRVPVDIEVHQAGWNVVPLSEAAISKAIGELEQYSFDPQFLAYNHLRIVGDAVDAGFFLITDGRELIRDNPALPVPTAKGDYYLVSFVSEGGRFPPTVGYEQVFPVGERPRTHAYMSSYLPRLLPKKQMKHECLLRSDGTDMKLLLNGTTKSEQISIRKSRIALLANFPSPGKKRLTLYYQPLGAHYLKIPQRRRGAVPAVSTKISFVGKAEKYLGNTKYRLGGNDVYEAWFAETTTKLTPTTQPPKTTEREVIEITTAANESQSFQLVLTPKDSFTFRAVRVTPLRGTSKTIDSSRIDVRAVEYVPVTAKARINQVKFFGKIGDPLVKVKPRRVHRADGNVAFWLTIRTPPATPPGSYRGTISVVGNDKASIDVPLKLTVYDFELPEYSTFRTHMGGQYFAKNSGDAKLNPTMVYHGVQSNRDLKKLARTYYEFMAKEKFYPKNVAMYVEIGMKWKKPPKGLNVDAPGNFFELVDWDFTEFNKCMKHFIDDLKVNSVCLTHTNPSVSHIFKHLPGQAVAKPNGDPGHVTMGWQTFRKMTQATYQKKPGDPWFDTSLLVTRKQWDRLVLDYYRAIVRNLEAHGWTDKFYYLIDETSGTEKILHLIRLLKGDPETSKIRFAHCLQGFESLWHLEGGKYKFNKLVTHVPQIDENYYRWEDYFWDDYNIPRDRDRLWSYAAYSSRLGINVPGMTNRQVGLEVFHLGGSGYVIWDTLMWHHHYGQADDPHNPWKDPYAKLANGALCYFYPPRRDGMPQTPDFTITPSLRIMTYRESVDDYEYARILEHLVATGRRKGRDVSAAEGVLADIKRMFPSSAEWTLNDAWYLELRDRMAQAIVELKSRIK